MSISGLLLFHVISFAYPFWPKITKIYTESDLYNATENSTELVGCNASRLSWCADLTPTNIYLYFISFALFIGKLFYVIL